MNRLGEGFLRLALMSLIVLAGNVATQLGHTQEKVSKEEMVLIGPFPLGDLYKLHARFDKDLGIGTDARIAVSFNACNVYLLQPKALIKGMWTFSAQPKVLLEGPPLHELKDAAGNDLIIQIAKWVVSADNLKYTVSPPTQRVRFSVDLRVTGTESVSGTYNITSDSFVCDINGKTPGPLRRKLRGEK